MATPIYEIMAWYVKGYDSLLGVSETKDEYAEAYHIAVEDMLRHLYMEGKDGDTDGAFTSFFGRTKEEAFAMVRQSVITS